jgi:hypothetical protein
MRIAAASLQTFRIHFTQGRCQCRSIFFGVDKRLFLGAECRKTMRAKREGE